MAAEFTLYQISGAYPGERQAQGSFGLLADFGAADALGVDKDPVLQGSTSYELWFQLGFAGTFTSVNTLKVFLVQPLPAGMTLLFNGVQLAYQTPVATTSSIATGTLPADYNGGANVSIGGSLAGALTAPGKSDYIVMQAVFASDFVRGGLDPIQIGVWYAES